MCFTAADAALRADTLIAALKCVHCQNLHFDTTPTIITSKFILSALYVVGIGMKVKWWVVFHWHC